MVLSSWSTKSLEDVIAVGKRNPYAMQNTNLKNRQVTEDVVRRAEAAGYKALFLTVDLPTLGNRQQEERYDFSFPKDLRLPNLALANANGPLDGGLELGMCKVDFSKGSMALTTIRSRDFVEYHSSMAAAIDIFADLAQRK
jgi:isopentenyl diphosphate isomerase/L-lactate dehydrogenase-like FMN-dependent dehydrogenase